MLLSKWSQLQHGCTITQWIDDTQHASFSFPPLSLCHGYSATLSQAWFYVVTPHPPLTKLRGPNDVLRRRAGDGAGETGNLTKLHRCHTRNLSSDAPEPVSVRLCVWCVRVCVSVSRVARLPALGPPVTLPTPGCIKPALTTTKQRALSPRLARLAVTGSPVVTSRR